MTAAFRHLLLLWGVLALALPVQAQRVLSEIRTDPASGVSVEVTLVFDRLPAWGTAPMWVRIGNAAAFDGEWQLRFSGWTATSPVTTAIFKVPAGETRTFFVAPVMGSSDVDPHLRLFGPGMMEEGSRLRIRGANTAPSQMLMLSRSLAERSPKRLEHRDRSREEFGFATFDPAELPRDWRGLIGVEWLAMTEAEWTALEGDSRAAIRRWVGQGGELVLVAFDPAATRWSPIFPALSAAGPHAYGSGHFRAIGWNSSEAPFRTFKALVQARKPLPLPQVSREWPPFQQLDTLKTPSLFIALFVVVFAILIGPVNLFWLAPAGRRHRLFATTPLLSLGGTAVLLLAIGWIDGTGGTGSRRVIIELFPDAGEVLVQQDQVVRSGLLLSSRFTLEQEAFLYPVIARGRSSSEMKIAGSTYSGAWFRSRSVQAHRLAAVRPAGDVVRQVGVSPSGAPVIVSGLENRFEKLLFCDTDGSFWQGSAFGKGEETTLEPVPKSERSKWTGWWEAMMADEAVATKRAAPFRREPTFAPGHLYAALADASGQAIETLDSIVWEEERVVLFGPMKGGMP